MKICIAQTRPVKGDINKNIDKHKGLIEIAISNGVDIIVFPELSLTGYEPLLAKNLATAQNDKRLDPFQEICDLNSIVIGVGLPTRENSSIYISMIIFQPHRERLTYSKQYLHPTEIDYFTAGQTQIYLNFEDNNVVAPAICYELSNPEHSETAHKNNANIYIASVLNSVNGVENDIKRLSDIAKKYKMTVFMANYTGQSGGYECAGKSSIWNKQGDLAGQLNSKNEGVLIFDTETKEVIEVTV
ncbi:MAG: carbon-nitrogen hydrolase family protein [Bacteroidales bacterium]|nr:MAG: carbon-nitrogen hydrolase family protein [Bacteroidales bacterium]